MTDKLLAHKNLKQILAFSEWANKLEVFTNNDSETPIPDGLIRRIGGWSLYGLVNKSDFQLLHEGSPARSGLRVEDLPIISQAILRAFNESKFAEIDRTTE